MTQSPPNSSARSRILTKVARRPLRRVRIGADELPQRARLHRQRRELTAKAVMYISAEPAPFLLAPDHQPLPRAQQRGCDLHAVGRHADLAREVVEQPPGTTRPRTCRFERAANAARASRLKAR